MRLFIAIDLPEEIKQILEEVKAPLKDIKGVKPVKKDNIHITLKFLGEVDDNKLSQIISALRKVSFKPFSVYLDKLGFFPNEKRIRVLWVDAKPEKPLKELKQQIDKVLPSFKDDHPFKSHITFARIKYIPSWNDKKKILELITNKQLGKKEFLVDTFKLYKSILTPKGPIYGVLNEFQGSNADDKEC